MKKIFMLTLLLLSIRVMESKGQTLYFPPVNNNAFWDTLSPASLGWCTQKIDSLYDFLEEGNSKAFMVLKDGKIVLEKYFGTFTQDSIWYWASAGKCLTSLLVGKASEEGFLQLSDSSSRFLGTGWTIAPPEKERLITIRNQITMTTGLDDGVPDNHCTIDTCLQYLADAGTRWSYHNAPYTLLDGVIEAATGQNLNAYTQAKVRNVTGLTGFWLSNGYDNVFYSRARSMARFGLLALNQFNWNGTRILTDTAFIRQSFSTSQNLNRSYGYLWWLNGKSSFMVPSLQTVFPGSWAPEAPLDMVAAMGKNGQMICVVPSKRLVMVRMGTGNGASDIPFLYCNDIWRELNKVICNETTSVPGPESRIHHFTVYPNPASESVTLRRLTEGEARVEIWAPSGNRVWESRIQGTEAVLRLPALPMGLYSLRLTDASGSRSQRIEILR